MKKIQRAALLLIYIDKKEACLLKMMGMKHWQYEPIDMALHHPRLATYKKLHKKEIQRKR